jgi:hypothetical protein
MIIYFISSLWVYEAPKLLTKLDPKLIMFIDQNFTG